MEPKHNKSIKENPDSKLQLTTLTIETQNIQIIEQFPKERLK